MPVKREVRQREVRRQFGPGEGNCNSIPLSGWPGFPALVYLRCQAVELHPALMEEISLGGVSCSPSRCRQVGSLMERVQCPVMSRRLPRSTTLSFRRRRLGRTARRFPIRYSDRIDRGGTPGGTPWVGYKQGEVPRQFGGLLRVPYGAIRLHPEQACARLLPVAQSGLHPRQNAERAVTSGATGERCWDP